MHIPIRPSQVFVLVPSHPCAMAFHSVVVCIIDNRLCNLLGHYQYSFTALSCLDKKCRAAIVVHGLKIFREALHRDVRSRTLNSTPLSPYDCIRITPFVSASRALLVRILDQYDVCSNHVVRLLRATLISRAHSVVRIRRILAMKPCFIAWRTLWTNAVRERRVSQCILSMRMCR